MSNFTRRFKKQGGASQDERLLQSLQAQAIALHQYANGSNWAYDHGRWIWLGEANGPELAEQALGIKSEKTKTLMELYRPVMDTRDCSTPAKDLVRTEDRED